MTAELGEGEPLADVGAVTGATVPEHLARMRELMPRTPFLLPGIGAQGGDVAALAPAFAPGRAAGLVSASRSIAGADEARGGDPARGRPRGGRAAARSGLAPRLGALARNRQERRYACPRWPVEAPRGSWPRSRWWPSSSRCSRSSDGGDGGGEEPANTQQPRADRDGDARRPPRKRKRKVYVVKPGDTPSGIAEKTGVSLEQLEEANPDLDPQLLAPGQRIRLPQ